MMNCIRMETCRLIALWWSLCLLGLWPPLTMAEEGLSALSEEMIADFDAQLDNMSRRRAVIGDLERRLGQSDETLRTVLEIRLGQSWSELIDRSLGFSRQVLAQQQAGVDVAGYGEQAIADLQKLPALAVQIEKVISDRMEIPEPDLAIAEQAAMYSRSFDLIKVRDKLYGNLFNAIDLSGQFGIDVEPIVAQLEQSLDDRAANTSVSLALAMDAVKGSRQALTLMPGDAEMQARLALHEQLVRSFAGALSSTVSLMSQLDMDTTSYREQIIGATGEISTDMFDPAVLLGLARRGLDTVLSKIVDEGPNILLKLLIFAGIVFLFSKLANLVRRLLEKALGQSQMQLSQLLRDMILGLCRNVVMIIGVLIGLSQIGIQLGPLLAGLGVAGFVIGFALQDTLSNFASGLMILSYRPFDVGDIVEAGGVSGKVSHMSLVNTTILTFDNQTNVVPNNKIWGNVIRNVTSQKVRRVDLTFGISYQDDIEKTEQLLQEIVAADDRVLRKPAPLIKLNALGDSSVDFVVRPWVKTEDYWDVYWELLRAVKLRFDEEGISIPYPQHDVHLDLSQPLSALRQTMDEEVQGRQTRLKS